MKKRNTLLIKAMYIGLFLLGFNTALFSSPISIKFRYESDGYATNSVEQFPSVSPHEPFPRGIKIFIIVSCPQKFRGNNSISGKTDKYGMISNFDFENAKKFFIFFKLDTPLADIRKNKENKTVISFRSHELIVKGFLKTKTYTITRNVFFVDPFHKVVDKEKLVVRAGLNVLKNIEKTNNWFRDHSGEKNWQPLKQIPVLLDVQSKTAEASHTRSPRHLEFFGNQIVLPGGNLLARKYFFPEGISHEYAHYIADVKGFDNPPGSKKHRPLVELDKDWYDPPFGSKRVLRKGLSKELATRLAWSEGWADFVGAAVHDKNGPGSGNPEVLKVLDESQLASSGKLELNFENSNTKRGSIWKGEDQNGLNNSGEVVEGAVASFLWDLYDITNEEEFSGSKLAPLPL